MSRNPHYDVLFEPVQIGPVTARNRFYQVPHCTGMGYEMPQTLAAMREVKAEGGWGVVCTEYCSIHPTSDDSPYPYATLWDDEDVKVQALMVDKVHRHGALAGVQLWYGGGGIANLLSRESALDVASFPSDFRKDPVQCQAMDKSDIRKLRRWQVDAARRALQGFLSHRLPWSIMSPLYEADFVRRVGPFDEAFPRLQDVDFHTRCLLEPSCRFAILPGKQADCFYRIALDRRSAS